MKFAVVEFPGSTCDHDMHYALRETLGQDAGYVWHESGSLDGFDVVVLPGGFSYGDYLRAGAIARFSPVMAAVAAFARRGGLVLGVCNGFQILTESGLLPGALMQNARMKFVCKDTYLKTQTTDAFVTRGLRKGEVLNIPVAHMEGRYVADESTLKRLEAEDRVLFRYCTCNGEVTEEANPNGSMGAIAGVLSEGRNVAGMMPHPERVCEESLGGVDGKKIFESILARMANV